MPAIQKTQKDIIQGTKEYIIKVARQLFSKYSYLGVSMNDIAKRLRITKPALYYHFSGKAEIYKKVLIEVFEKLNSQLSQAIKEKTPKKKLEKLIHNYLKFGLKEKNLIKVLMVNLPSGNQEIRRVIIRLRKRTVKLIHNVVEEVAKKKKPNQKVNVKLSTFLLIGMLNGLLLEYSFFNKKVNLKRLAKEITAFCFDNL